MCWYPSAVVWLGIASERNCAMRRASLVSVVVALVLLCVASAYAGSVNEIVLGGSSGAPIKFTGTGTGGQGGLGANNFSVNFNIQNLLANGSGTLFSSGYYSIVNAGASIYGLSSSCGGGSCTFMLGETSPMMFTYGSAPGGSDLLIGQLYLVDLTQTGTNGVFNDQLVINFVATGGSLQSAFGGGNGEIQLTIKFTTSQSLSTILDNKTLMAKVVSGAVFPVPEPASLAILGASLLGLVAVGKKKKLFA